MSSSFITNKEKEEVYIQIWKYLSANGKLFIPVYDTADSSAVYAENTDKDRKTIRAFLDSEAIQVYLIEKQELLITEDPGAILKVGVAPVKTLQQKLSEVYGKDQKDGLTVECLLTSYDDMGNMRTVDTIWTQASN